MKPWYPVSPAVRGRVTVGSRTMTSSNRELVEFFLCHRLGQRNYPTAPLRPQDAGDRTLVGKDSSAASNGLQDSSKDGRIQPPHDHMEGVKSALLQSANEFELLFTQGFNNLSTQLHITPDTAYNSFKNVMDEVFKDGVNWGRVVGLFVFGGMLCVDCSEKDMSELVPRIADWMTMYLDENINEWIEGQGGWECFASIFGQDAAAEARRSRDRMRRWCMVGAAMLTGVLVAAIVARRQ